MHELKEELNIENMIYEIRWKQVMLDSDLAKLYQCKNGTKEINQAVKNNPYRFSECFLFCLYEKNPKNFGSKISTQNIKMWKYVKKVLSCRNKFKYFKYKKNYVIIYDSRVI